MAMGIVDDNLLEKELANINRASNKPTVKIPELVDDNTTPGRNIGDRNVPDALRSIISETSQLEGRQEALKLAKQFGISASSVSAYNSGKNSTSATKENPNIINHVNRSKEIIGKKARIVLRKALTNITEDKLTESSATELASVAKSMSSIVKEMEPSVIDEHEKNAPQIVIYAPQIRNEQSFEFIQVNE